MYQRKNSSTAEIKLEENLVEYKKIKENSFSSVKDKLCRGSGSLCRVQRLFQFKMLCICIQILLFVRKNNLLFLTLLLKTNLFSSFKYKKRTTGSDKNPVFMGNMLFSKHGRGLYVGTGTLLCKILYLSFFYIETYIPGPNHLCKINCHAGKSIKKSHNN